MFLHILLQQQPGGHSRSLEGRDHGEPEGCSSVIRFALWTSRLGVEKKTTYFSQIYFLPSESFTLYLVVSVLNLFCLHPVSVLREWESSAEPAKSDSQSILSPLGLCDNMQKMRRLQSLIFTQVSNSQHLSCLIIFTWLIFDTGILIFMCVRALCMLDSEGGNDSWESIGDRMLLLLLLLLNQIKAVFHIYLADTDTYPPQKMYFFSLSKKVARHTKESVAQAHTRANSTSRPPRQQEAPHDGELLCFFTLFRWAKMMTVSPHRCEFTPTLAWTSDEQSQKSSGSAEKDMHKVTEELRLTFCLLF